jgi:hypothetical protein
VNTANPSADRQAAKAGAGARAAARSTFRYFAFLTKPRISPLNALSAVLTA